MPRLQVLEDRLLLDGDPVDFSTTPIQSYAGAQDADSTVRVADGGATLEISGNGWKKIALPYTVTDDTVLSFDLTVPAQGEIHGIGFDTDDKLSRDRFFQLHGTQDWGIDPGPSYAGGTKHYEIAVGEFFTGDFDFLTFANDHDVSDPSAETRFSNVTLCERATDTDPNLTFTPGSILSYAGRQDAGGTATVDPVYFGAQLRLEGNTWKKVARPTSLTAQSVLEFDFHSPREGELQGIGFANGDAIDGRRIFQLHGVQDQAYKPGVARHEAVADEFGWTHYRIPVGQFFQGDFDYVTFVNDDDRRGGDGVGVFANVKIVESPPAIQEVVVHTRQQFLDALNAAGAGTHILVAPGTYAGGIYASGVAGAAGNPVVIRALDPGDAPVFDNTGRGGDIVKLQNARHVEIHDLVLQNGWANGLNIDDGGDYATPSEHILISNLTIRHFGGGNRDGIKLSGVDHFRVVGLDVSDWGTGGGSGIDVVGGHFGVIERSTFRHGGNALGNGVQLKGGSKDILVRFNRFDDAGARAVQIGGKTDLKYFRPGADTVDYEAKDVTVEHNVIVGSEAAVTFVNSDGGLVRHNTIHRPSQWVFRILKEQRAGGFVDTRNGVVERNIVVFGDELAKAVNVGSSTEPGSFAFAANWWYNVDDPSDSVPWLPASETGGVHGIDPQLLDPAAGDFRLDADSPAAAYGAYARR